MKVERHFSEHHRETFSLGDTQLIIRVHESRPTGVTLKPVMTTVDSGKYPANFHEVGHEAEFFFVRLAATPACHAVLVFRLDWRAPGKTDLPGVIFECFAGALRQPAPSIPVACSTSGTSTAAGHLARRKTEATQRPATHHFWGNAGRPTTGCLPFGRRKAAESRDSRLLCRAFRIE